jgi:hypothetical protein
MTEPRDQSRLVERLATKVVYKQVNESDGFIVTAYFTSRPASWRRVIWKR